jgi:hypothetical protein
MLITAVAVVLLVLAVATLRDASPEITAAVILFLVVLAGIGIGASVDVHSSNTHSGD